MKSIRKSLNSNKDSIRSHISVPLPQVSKPAPALAPPQKVIRALQTYKPQAPQELPFQKGDFFYVIRDDVNNQMYYEAHNPVTGARGFVARAMFEEFSKSSNAPGANVSVSRPASTVRSSTFGASKLPKTKVFYAVVLHDFTAERPDELDAKRGDAVSVVAQSNREWFVAKPIDRVGRPGLIPASFVEIRDPATGSPVVDVESLMDRGELPKVEDWKRSVFEYKQNSISLGVIDAPSNPANRYTSPATVSQQQMPPAPPEKFAPSQPSPISPQSSTQSQADIPPPQLPDGILLSADVVSFHLEMEEFWFRVDAVYQPYAPPGQSQLPPAKRLILFRVYNDFYDFQVALLGAFPKEAGREPPADRILPYMPGPSDNVTQELTETRRSELDDYLHRLCDLSKYGNKYILEDAVVRSFCSLKPGDVENDIDARTEEVEELFSLDLARRQAEEEGHQDDEYGGEVRDQLGQMRVSSGDQSDGSEYEDEGYGSQPPHHHQDQEHHPYHQYDGRREDSGPSHQNQRSRMSAASSQDESYGRSSSPYDRPSDHDTSGWTNGSSRNHNGHERSKVPSLTSSHSTSSAQSFSAPSFTSGRSRSHSTSNALNTPPISAANSQAAFVKIKIFDRLSDDLIAIRVHPQVSHAELVEKVQNRLGGEVLNLRYRDSFKNDLVILNGDGDLRAWMEGTDKYVLYAD